MATQSLIYKCILTDHDFKLLRSDLKDLNLVINDLSLIDRSHLENCNYYLSFIIRDYQELIYNKPLGNYKFNSYILQLLVVKLHFVYDFKESKHIRISINQLTIIKRAITNLHQIIDSTYDTYINDLR